jgi:opacity protein-like surface antigen
MARVAMLVVLVFAASPALAQSYSRTGWTAGASASVAFEDFDDGSFDDTGAVGAFLGYRVHPNVAVEGRLEQTGEFDGDFGLVDVDVDILTLTANAQIFLATEQFQPYVIGGVGFAHAEADVDPGGDDDETDPLVRLGVGLDSYVSPTFAIGAEAAYNYGFDDLDDFNYWTLSALFRFRF